MSKKKAALWILIGAVIIAVCWLGAGLLLARPESGDNPQVIGLRETPVGEDFKRVTGPEQMVFPRDFGPHPDFRTEWWYYTGNIQGENGRSFGYQLTFFRRALLPANQRSPRESDLAVEQVYMAHFALSDISGGRFYAFERFERGAAGLAGSVSTPTYQVWLRDWRVEQVGEDEYALNATQDGISLNLRLVDRKGIILQGKDGYSQKGPETGNASLYYSQTRLESSGTIKLGEQEVQVSGLSWLDREISTLSLSETQVGWDWFALQLDDGSELMVYVLRNKDGSAGSFSSGTLIRPDSTTIFLKNDDFQVKSSATWTSPISGGTYPAQWQVSVPGENLELHVTPLLEDQELNLSYTYWEGAVKVSGSSAGNPVRGRGYVELTGYAKLLEGI